MNRTTFTAALLLSLPLSLAATPKASGAKCEPVQVGAAVVWAKRLPSGNYSTTACEPEITIRLTDRARGGFEVRPTKSAFHCTVWLSQIRRPMPSLADILAGCHAAMDAASK